MVKPEYLSSPDNLMCWDFLTEVWGINLKRGFEEFPQADRSTAMHAAAHLLKMTIREAFNDLPDAQHAGLKEVDSLLERISHWRPRMN
jgi:hypothetical protein